ncbi:YhdT family protein [Sporosarcina gallistercoris]|uniref:YhdT family protein n=1 Tax=Sporosarcina gallistercoris TaxID=2762245 RepID=A0ABR8PLX6_9BACL|nr:YhdT family protein [Sporosarcina gallistercoris]MBD7909130.1 YhdT family protein [Sporosarcina gallistercoris]
MRPDTPKLPNSPQPKEHKQDPRFKTAHKEAWIGVALAVFNFVWWFGFAYGLGGRPVEEYTYILGLPDWFFWSCVVGFILMSIITVVLAKFVLTDMPLDDDPTYHPAQPDTRTQKGPNS